MLWSGAQATVEELAATLISHPLYGEMLAAADGVSKESLAADRYEGGDCFAGQGLDEQTRG
jgi:hypothetical protein